MYYNNKEDNKHYHSVRLQPVISSNTAERLDQGGKRQRSRRTGVSQFIGIAKNTLVLFFLMTEEEERDPLNPIVSEDTVFGQGTCDDI